MKDCAKLNGLKQLSNGGKILLQGYFPIPAPSNCSNEGKNFFNME